MSLITTIEQVRDHIGNAIRKEHSLEILTPYLKKTEENLITDLIGQQQLTALYASVSGSLETLKNLVVAAIVWNGYQEAWYQAFYQFGITGVNRTAVKETDNLFRYQEDAILKDIVRKADDAIERLMLFLERNLETFPLYKQSAQFSRNFAYLVSTPGSLQRSLPEVSKSYRMYSVLRLYMDRVELNTVRSTVGSDLYNDLKLKVSTSAALDSNYKKLLILTQDYVAPATLLEAMPWISIQFSPSGIRIMKVFNNLQDENPLSDIQAQSLMDNLRSRIASAKSALRVFLNSVASETVFPDYFHSDLYQAVGSKKWIIPDNSGRKHFRM